MALLHPESLTDAAQCAKALYGWHERELSNARKRNLDEVVQLHDQMLRILKVEIDGLKALGAWKRATGKIRGKS